MAELCSVEGCEKKKDKRGWCGMHYRRMQRHGTLDGNRRDVGSGTIMKSGHVSLHVNKRVVYEHVLIVEKALGKKLPKGAQIHHVDLNPANNDLSNLVMCPNDAYHKLLHKRQRALDSCGNPNFLKCHFCKKYDDPKNLANRIKGNAHAECQRVYDRNNYAKKKNEKSA